mgnify:CR=1 FL=1
MKPLISLFLLCAWMCPSPSHGTDYEVPKPRTVEEALPQELRTGPHDRVEEPVQHDGYMYTYTIETDYGVFLAHGDVMLRRLRQGLTAIGDMQERNSTGVAVGSAGK